MYPGVIGAHPGLILKRNLDITGHRYIPGPQILGTHTETQNSHILFK